MGTRFGAHRTGAVNGVVPRVLPDKLDWVLQARQRLEIKDTVVRIKAFSAEPYKDLIDNRLKPKYDAPTIALPDLVHAYDPPLTLPSHNLANYHGQPSIGTFRVPFAAPKPTSLASSPTSSPTSQRPPRPATEGGARGHLRYDAWQSTSQSTSRSEIMSARPAAFARGLEVSSSVV